LEPSDHFPGMAAAIVWMISVERQGYPDLVVSREVEPVGQHSDHRRGPVIHPNGLADHVRITGEKRSPEAITDHGNVVSGLVLLSRKSAAQHRLNAQQRKQRPGSAAASDALRLDFVAAEIGAVVWIVGGHLLECLIRVKQLEKFRIGKR